jgi:hypothetical protein
VSSVHFLDFVSVLFELVMFQLLKYSSLSLAVSSVVFIVVYLAGAECATL